MTAPSAVRPEVPELLDGPGLATRLGITERHVRRLVAERRIPFVKVGRFVRFDPFAVSAWLEQSSVEARR
jgi:excisionase family DNA binding protein